MVVIEKSEEYGFINFPAVTSFFSFNSSIKLPSIIDGLKEESMAEKFEKIWERVSPFKIGVAEKPSGDILKKVQDFLKKIGATVKAAASVLPIIIKSGNWVFVYRCDPQTGKCTFTPYSKETWEAQKALIAGAQTTPYVYTMPYAPAYTPPTYAIPYPVPEEKPKSEEKIVYYPERKTAFEQIIPYALMGFGALIAVLLVMKMK